MNRKVIIMGASSGLGREVALRLLGEGWTVGVAARRADLLATLAANGRRPVATAQIDVTHADAGVQLHRLIDQMGGVDLYLHVSGVGRQNPELDADAELQTVETNGMGFVRMVGEAFRWMADHGGGHIAVISSVAGVRGLGPAPSYSATKAFQNTYVQALEQLSNNRGLNIRFTDIRPGFVDTDFLRGSHFPMMLSVERAADAIVSALKRQDHVCVVDWRWRVVVFFWQWVPAWLWRRLPIAGRSARR